MLYVIRSDEVIFTHLTRYATGTGSGDERGEMRTNKDSRARRAESEKAELCEERKKNANRLNGKHHHQAMTTQKHLPLHLPIHLPVTAGTSADTSAGTSAGAAIPATVPAPSPASGSTNTDDHNASAACVAMEERGQEAAGWEESLRSSERRRCDV